MTPTTHGGPATGRALVTGVTGFVGGPTVRALTQEGIAVRGLVRNPARLGPLAPLLESAVQGDLSNVNALRAAASGCDTVVHIAGLTKAWRARDYFDVNTEGTRRAALAAREATPRPRRFVLVSSLAAAGPSASEAPRTEAEPCAPVSEYGRSKLGGELAAREVLAGSDLELVILRPPIVYGEGDRDVLTVFQQVARGWIPVVGGRTALTKGYSLIHVEDLADAIVAACVKPAPPGAAYFVPGPRDATFEGMLEAIEAAVGRRARRIPVPMAAAAVGAAAAQAVGAILRRASIVNLDKLREASAPGWRCSGAAAARDLGHRPAVDYPDGFARQARFARDAGLL